MLEVTQSFSLQLTPANYVFIARVLFYPSNVESILTYDIQILFTIIQSGEVNDSQQIIEVCSMITRKSEFKFCLGRNEKRYYDDYHTPIGYHLKNVRIWDKPLKRLILVICDLILETYLFGTLVNFLFYSLNQAPGAHLSCVKISVKISA